VENRNLRRVLPMARFSVVVCCAVLALTIAPIISHCQAPGGTLTGDPATEAARRHIEKGEFTQALAIVEEGLKAAPEDPAMLMCQIDALMGLHRSFEARQTAFAHVGMGPEFRFKAGLCTARFGRLSEALGLWQPLLSDKTWAAPAYHESALALVALGKEDQAKSLLAEALGKLPSPPVSLVMLDLQLTGNAKEGKVFLDKVKPADANATGEVNEMKALFSAAGGDLDQISMTGKTPAVIRIKEKTERVETTSLSWGGSGAPAFYSPGAGAGSATSSSTQGYGAGMKDTSQNEGNRTGTISSAPRAVVEAELDGKREEYMVLDSSSDVVLISSRVAKKLDAKPIAPGAYSGIGLPSPVPSDWVLLKSIVVGPVTFTNIPALVIDEKTAYWKETGGVLPIWLFRDYGLHYDRRHSKLTLYPSGTSPDQVLGQGAMRLNALWYGGKPYVETRVQNRPLCFMLLSTANVGSYLEQRRAEDMGIDLTTSKYGPQNAQGLFGIISSGVADKVSLDLGSTRINLPTILVSDLCPDNQLECYGILGRNILDLFDFYIDYHANVLALKGYEKGR
jgi:hypothetical protein